MKKAVSILLALGMILSLAACSANDPTPSPKAPASTPGATTEDAANIVQEAENIEVEFWYQNSNYTTWIEKMAADFHAVHENITITPVIHGTDEALTAALTAAFQDNSAPAIFHCRVNASYASYVDAGLMEDLSNYDFASKISESLKEGASMNGILGAAPLGYSAFCVIYNQDIFDELGLTAPRNFDEMLNVVNACKDVGYGGIAYPGGNAGHVWLSRAMWFSTMQAEYKNFEEGIDNGTITDLTEYPDAMDAMRSMSAYGANDLWYNGSDSMAFDAELTLFTNRECAMIVTYTGQMIAQEALADMNLGIFPFASLTSNGTYYGEVNNMIGMWSGATDEQKAASALFIDFCLQDDNLSYYASTLGELVSVDGIVADHKYGELFAKEMVDPGITMRALAVDHNTEYWKAELDAMLLDFTFNGADVDSNVETYSQHLKEADIASIA